MSKSLIKLIDSALLPAALMICGKVAGLYLVNKIFNLTWGIITDPNNFFSVRIVYSSVEDQITATSYSNLIMVLFLLIGFSLILIRALVLHSSHVSPRVIAQLATNNLMHLVKDSFEIYHEASVWLILLWLSLAALLINILLGRAYPWTGILCFTCVLLATITLLKDVMNEVILAKKKLFTRK